jgi:hypothetical protein
MPENRSSTDNGAATRRLITRAFRNLRSRGFFAKQNWYCCQSCGCAALPVGTTRWAFYHAQDADSLREDGSVFLSWGGDGHTIVKALEGVGLRVEWDGTESRRILTSAAPLIH